MLIDTIKILVRLYALNFFLCAYKNYLCAYNKYLIIWKVNFHVFYYKNIT